MNDQLCVLPHDIERLAQDGHYLCPGHVKALPERIRQLADLHDQLADNLTATGTPAERRAKSEAIGLNLSPKVIELRDAIKNELAGWARIVCEDRGVHYSATDNIHSIAAFLITHADWISAQPFADDLWTQLVYDPRGDVTRRKEKLNGELVTVITDTRALRTQARSLLQPSGTRRMDIGHERCLNVTCDGFLVALVRDTDELLPSKVWCEGCGQEWPAGSWLTLGRKIRERQAG